MGSPSPPTFNCAIIGAGIAGLSAAVALRRAGHVVDVYEKSSFKNEIGAAMTVQPNAAPILERWGFDVQQARGDIEEGIQNRNLATGEETGRSDVSDDRALFKYPAMHYHRVDIHTQLKELALAAGATIHLSSEIIELDCASGRLKFSDGSLIERDLVVIASGIHCKMVEQISGVDPGKVQFGAMYRGLVPMHRIEGDPEASLLHQRSGYRWTIAAAPPRVWISYPCRNGTLLNVALFDSLAQDADVEDWNLPVSKERVLDVLKDAHPMFQAVVRVSDEFVVYPFQHKTPIARYNNGKAVLIGDAAHAMLPQLAQGGSMAIEDAASFEVLFDRAHWTSHDSVENTLRLFNELRWPRNCAVQVMSNFPFRPFFTEEHTQAAAKYYDGPRFPSNIHRHSAKFKSTTFLYDVYREANKAMQHRHDADGLPRGLIQHFHDSNAMKPDSQDAHGSQRREVVAL